MKKAVCKICQNYQVSQESCVAPRNMFALRKQEGMVCQPLRMPMELNRNHDCAWFDKIPLTDRLFKMVGLKKPQFLTAIRA